MLFLTSFLNFSNHLPFSQMFSSLDPERWHVTCWFIEMVFKKKIHRKKAGFQCSDDHFGKDGNGNCIDSPKISKRYICAHSWRSLLLDRFNEMRQHMRFSCGRLSFYMSPSSFFGVTLFCCYLFSIFICQIYSFLAFGVGFSRSRTIFPRVCGWKIYIHRKKCLMSENTKLELDIHLVLGRNLFVTW